MNYIFSDYSNWNSDRKLESDIKLEFNRKSDNFNILVFTLKSEERSELNFNNIFYVTQLCKISFQVI